MKAFVITFYGKRMLAPHPVPHRPQRGEATGWNPYVWTADIALAEKFDDPHSAHEFAAITLRPGIDFTVVELMPRPLDPTGVA